MGNVATVDTGRGAAGSPMVDGILAGRSKFIGSFPSKNVKLIPLNRRPLTTLTWTTRYQLRVGLLVFAGPAALFAYRKVLMRMARLHDAGVGSPPFALRFTTGLEPDSGIGNATGNFTGSLGHAEAGSRTEIDQSGFHVITSELRRG